MANSRVGTWPIPSLLITERAAADASACKLPVLEHASPEEILTRHRTAIDGRRIRALGTPRVTATRNLWLSIAASVLTGCIYIPDLLAGCSPAVSASWANGVVTYNATSTGTCGWSGVTAGIDTQDILQWYDCPATTCTHQYVQSTECMSAGPHTVFMHAKCSNSDANGCGYETVETASTTFVVVTKPHVALSFTGPDANGNVQVNVTYSFPNGYAASSVQLDYEIDGQYHGYYQLQPVADGTWTETYNTTCWPKSAVIRARVSQCSSSEEYRNEDRRSIDVFSKPTVSVAVVPAAGGGYNALVNYSFPNTTDASQRTIELHRLKTGALLVPAAHPLDREGQLPPIAVVCALDDDDAVYAVAESCAGYHVVSDAASIPMCELSCRTPGCPECFGDPVHGSSGSMEYSDGDPLAGSVISSLQRTYQSRNASPGVFGTGWTTILDSYLVAHGGTDGRDVVFLQLEDGSRYGFRKVGNVYEQNYPSGDRNMGTLLFDSATDTFRHRRGGQTLTRQYRASDGKLASIGFPGADTVIFTYGANGKPAYADDGWSRWQWHFIYGPSGFVETIEVAGRSELSWSYGYSGANLVTVTAPSGTWRTYSYGIHGMEVAYDGRGSEIESHSYDAEGRALTSDGPTDNITDIQLQLPGRVTGEWRTRTTTADGKITNYYMRYIGGMMRTVEIDGLCGCSGEDSVFVHDARGNAIREQNARGYITTRTFLNGRLASESTYDRPANCDPEADSLHCRLSPDDLSTVELTATPLTTYTTFAYDDPNWPDKVTLRSMDSLRSGSLKREMVAYDAVSGQVTAQTIYGYDPTDPMEPERMRASTTTLYNGSEAAAFDPCGGSSCEFQSSWLALAQPASLPRLKDGPRTDGNDWTTFVYYPIDGTVPIDARGRLAAVRNALGHITRYEDYDAFGNARRVIDPNGVVTEKTYDSLGRPLTSTLKAVSGCDTSIDPLCATDAVTHQLYDPATGPLAIQVGPRGEATTYEYDVRGRTVSSRRGEITGTVPPTASAAIAAAAWKEKVSYEYAALTGRKVAERLYAWESDSWVEKKYSLYTYDSEGHLQTMTHPDGVSVGYTYDRGQLSAVKDENHAEPNTFYEYDGAGHLKTVTQMLIAAGGALPPFEDCPSGPVTGDNAVTRYAYDRHGNLSAVTDPNGNVTSYGYDDFGDLKQQLSPVTGTTRYAYDAAGNLVETVDANDAITTRTYDLLGRVTDAVSTKTGEPDETVTWTYDGSAPFGRGRASQMSDPSGTTAYRYERRGLLALESRTIGASAYTTSFQYDLSGNRTRLGYPYFPPVLYTYDYAERPMSATLENLGWVFVQSASYLPFGPLTEIHYGNATVQSMGYDSRYRMVTNQLSSGPTTIASYSYGHDSAGNITAIDDLTNAGYSRAFGYDDLNRLVSTTTGQELWRESSYRYDAMGNILFTTQGVESDDPEFLRRRKLSAESVLKRTTSFCYSGTTKTRARQRRRCLASRGRRSGRKRDELGCHAHVFLTQPPEDGPGLGRGRSAPAPVRVFVRRTRDPGRANGESCKRSLDLRDAPLHL